MVLHTNFIYCVLEIEKNSDELLEKNFLIIETKKKSLHNDIYLVLDFSEKLIKILNIL